MIKKIPAIMLMLTALCTLPTTAVKAEDTSLKIGNQYFSNLNGGAMSTYFNQNKVEIESNNVPISGSENPNGLDLSVVNDADTNMKISGQSPAQENITACIQTPEWVAEQQRIAEKQQRIAEEQAKQEEMLKEQQASLYTVEGRNFSCISEDEFNLLCRIVSAEAGSSEYCSEAQEMIAEVILNRMDSSSFPNDLTSVIYADGQFQPVTDGNLDSAVITDSVKKSVFTALKEIHHPKNMLYFRANYYHEGLTDYEEVCGTYFSLK